MIALVLQLKSDLFLSPPLRLIVFSGDVMGRLTKCEHQLTNLCISREHCQFHCKDNKWYITDLGSTNGTKVNDNFITGKCPITSGDVITIGNYYTFVVEPVK